MSLQWRIWYGDGTTFSSAEGSPYYAPRQNVQVIAGADPLVGRYMAAARDAYWWDISAQRWFGGDRWGEWDYMCQLGPRVVLYGRTVSDDAYNACIAAALADPDFPKKSAIGRAEEFLGV